MFQSVKVIQYFNLSILVLHWLFICWGCCIISSMFIYTNLRKINDCSYWWNFNSRRHRSSIIVIFQKRFNEFHCTFIFQFHSTFQERLLHRIGRSNCSSGWITASLLLRAQQSFLLLPTSFIERIHLYRIRLQTGYPILLLRLHSTDIKLNWLTLL